MILWLCAYCERRRDTREGQQIDTWEAGRLWVITSRIQATYWGEKVLIRYPMID